MWSRAKNAVQCKWISRGLRSTQAMTITLPPHMAQFVANEVAKGAYRSPEEVVQASLQLLHQQQMAALRREIQIAVEQSQRREGMPFTPELEAQLWNEAMA